MTGIEIHCDVTAHEDGRAMRSTARVSHYRVNVRFGRKSRA